MVGDRLAGMLISPLASARRRVAGALLVLTSLTACAADPGAKLAPATDAAALPPAVIAALPLVVLLILFQRQIVRGLTAGAVKG